jgi:NADH-quinone oxidoreductase subunit J
MPHKIDYIQWIFGTLLVLFSLGVITARKPLYSALCFLATLLSLAGLFLELSAQFIAVLQILVYAGAILVIFVFVIVLFQDAHEQLSHFQVLSNKYLIAFASVLFLSAWVVVGRGFLGLEPVTQEAAPEYGTVRSLGEALYVDFFFPFEAVVVLLLVAVVGSVYIAKRES